ncbi:MAG: flagellar biosynthetic protein FliO [Geobacteraceae bacterium]|nr:flagellar biosynthetic protein FliO [Geobacteraceae bacterium]
MRTFLVLLFIAAPMFTLAASADPNDLSLVPMTLKMLASLGVVVGLFLLLYALVRKSRAWLPGGNTQEFINVRAVRHLGPKRTLYLVDVDGHRFFISAAGEQIRLLSEWEAPHGNSNEAQEATDAGVEADGGGKTSFAALLQRQFKTKKSDLQAPVTPPGAQAGGTSDVQEDKSCPEA